MMHHQCWVFPQFYWIGKVCSSAKKKKNRGQCHSVFITHYKLKYIPSEEQRWLVCIRHELQPRKGKENKRKNNNKNNSSQESSPWAGTWPCPGAEFYYWSKRQIVVLMTSGFWAPSPLCSANAHATGGSSSSCCCCYGFTPRHVV